MNKLKRPNEFLKSFISKFDKTDRNIFITVFIAGLISSFYFIIGHGIAHDALDSNFLYTAEGWETALGRFSLRFLDYCQHSIVNQLLVVLVSLFFISCAIIIVRRLFKIKQTSVLLIISALTAIAPQFNESYFYVYCADAYLLAFFLSALTVFALTKRKKLCTVLAVLLTVLICSLYQPYLGVLIGLIIILAIKEALDQESIKQPLKNFIRNIIITFIGVVFILHFIPYRLQTRTHFTSFIWRRRLTRH